jgi:hypothetical protein
MMESRWRGAGLAVLLVCLASPALAEWSTNGSLVCGAALDQRAPVAITDGAGGAIIAWEDRRSGGGDIYAQRVSATGWRLWGPNGVAIGAASGEQVAPSIVSDQAGGAIVVWEDVRGNGDVYAQRVNGAGVVQWAADGVPVCAALGAQHNPIAAADGAGGVLVTWWDQRSLTADVYAQRLDAAGAAQWRPDGVLLSNAAGDQLNPVLVGDGAGGAIVAWFDERVHAQRINAVGTPLWGAPGLDLTTTVEAQSGCTIVGDGAGGAIVTWTDLRAQPDQDIYAQRLDGSGARLWGDSARIVCAASGFQFAPVTAADGAGGVIVAWRDLRGASADIYAQRLGASGSAQWTADGVAACDAGGDQFSPALVTQTGGGAIVGWHDLRGASSDIYARGITSAGAPQWAAGGAVVCDTTGDQQTPAIVPDGAGGAILIWDDARSGTDTDLYASRIDGDGMLVPVLLALVRARATPGHVELVWHAAGPAGRPATVERRTADTDWAAIGAVRSDASGRFVFDDRAVAPGQRLAYRLVIVGQDGRSVSTETWIEIPNVVALALESVRPHPVEREWVVALSLPEDGAARLELLDVTGRRVVVRTLEALEAGRHLVRFQPEAPLPGGIYVLRLVQGAGTATLKVVTRR